MNSQTLPACPVCAIFFKEGSYRSVPYPVVRETLLNNIPTAINLCGNCGVGIAAPAWSSGMLEKFYSEGGYWKNSNIETVSAKKYPTPYALAVSRWKMIEPLFGNTHKPVSVLDVGAGYGLLGMVIAKSKKVRIEKYVCVEKDSFVAESLRKTWLRYFPQVHFDVKDSIDQVNEDFDIAVLSHVLEHQSNPRKMLRAVLGKVFTGGVVLVEVPNQDYLFKKDVFPHLIFFTASGLQLLLKDCDFTVESLGCYGHSMKQSPLNYRNVNGLGGVLSKVVMATRIIIPEPILLSFFTLYWGANMQNNDGTWIRAVLRKNVPGSQEQKN